MGLIENGARSEYKNIFTSPASPVYDSTQPASKLTALLLTGTILQYWLPIFLKERSLAQTTSTTTCTALARHLKVQEQRHAAAAWNYFQANYEASTGLVSDRSDIKTSSIWGIGDDISALHTARSLDIISAQEFDQRTQQVLTTFKTE